MYGVISCCCCVFIQTVLSSVGCPFQSSREYLFTSSLFCILFPKTLFSSIVPIVPGLSLPRWTKGWETKHQILTTSTHISSFFIHCSGSAILHCLRPNNSNSIAPCGCFMLLYNMVLSVQILFRKKQLSSVPFAPWILK